MWIKYPKCFYNAVASFSMYKCKIIFSGIARTQHGWVQVASYPGHSLEKGLGMRLRYTMFGRTVESAKATTGVSEHVPPKFCNVCAFWVGSWAIYN